MTPSLVPVKIDQFPLVGGLDLHTPQSQLAPGFVRDAQNFEASIGGGYSTTAGYERFDGRPSPSDSIYGVLQVDQLDIMIDISEGGSRVLIGTRLLAVGDTITGAESGATGYVMEATKSVAVVADMVGSMQDGETYMVGSSETVGNIVGVGAPETTTEADFAHYAWLAYMLARESVGPVPGAGPILGGFAYLGNNYAWRKSSSGDWADLHVATSFGWVVLLPSLVVRFTNGFAEPAAGQALTTGTGSATVRRAIVQSGTWASATAAGIMVITNLSGAISSGQSSAFAVLTSAPFVDRTPIGRFEHDQYNFGAGPRIYGANGAGKAFEFDGVSVVSIDTGNATDRPTHVRAHRSHLFLSFGASAQHSSIGDPHNWTALAGAGELPIGDSITGFERLPGNHETAALGIYSRTGIAILYGKSAVDWSLDESRTGAGSRAYGHQVLDGAYVYDDLGVFALSAVQNYGNFQPSSLTSRIRSFVQDRRNILTDSAIHKEKSQLRLFYADGSALYTTIVNGKLLGSMPLFFPKPVLVTWRSPAVDEPEASYFGASDGYVYRMDTGTSFDGEPIDAWFTLAYRAKSGDRVNNRFRRLALEASGESYAEFRVGYSLQYADPMRLQPAEKDVSAKHAAAKWDQFTWDQFTWDASQASPVQARLEGTATTIAISVSSSSKYWRPFVVSTAAIHYSPRTVIRR